LVAVDPAAVLDADADAHVAVALLPADALADAHLRVGGAGGARQLRADLDAQLGADPVVARPHAVARLEAGRVRALLRARAALLAAALVVRDRHGGRDGRARAERGDGRDDGKTPALHRFPPGRVVGICRQDSVRRRTW